MARKISENSSRNYFTAETEKYIVLYNSLKDFKEKDKILREHLYFPFYKLAENIINTFKFYYTDTETIEDLKKDVIAMIFQDKIFRFDPTRGTKAFSYFGTVIKRWLITYNKKNYKKLKNKVDVSHCEGHLYETQEQEFSPVLTIPAFFDCWVVDTYDHLEELFPEEPDKSIADAVLTVFRTRSDLQIFNKKALYLYVREITGCDTPCLTKVIKQLKENYYKKFKEFKDRDLIDFED